MEVSQGLRPVASLPHRVDDLYPAESTIELSGFHPQTDGLEYLQRQSVDHTLAVSLRSQPPHHLQDQRMGQRAVTRLIDIEYLDLSLVGCSRVSGS